MKRIPSIFAALTVWLVCSWAVHAAITLEPLRTELAAPPGATVEGKITVSNSAAGPLELFVTFDDRTDLLDENDEEYSWVDIDTGTNLLSGGESLDVHYTVRVPQTHRGELFGRVGFTYRTETIESGPGVSVGIQQKISVPLYVTIKGTEDYRAEIVSMILTETNPISLHCSILHHGNVHLLPTGECTVIRMKNNREAARFPINPRRFVVFPGQTNLVAGKSFTQLRPGDYEFNVSIPFPDENNLLEQSLRVSIPPPTSTEKGTSP